MRKLARNGRVLPITLLLAIGVLGAVLGSWSAKAHAWVGSEKLAGICPEPNGVFCDGFEGGNAQTWGITGCEQPTLLLPWPDSEVSR